MKLTIQIVQLITCCLLIMAIAINKNQRLFGLDLTKTESSSNNSTVDEWTTKEGLRVISTQNLAKDVWGFGGNIPLHIYLKENHVEKIEVQEHSESPDFFTTVEKSGLLKAWNGLTPQEAIGKQVDAVSGATMSSTAVIQSVQKAMNYIQNGNTGSKNNFVFLRDFIFWCTFMVVVGGLVIPIYYKNKKYRFIQLILNVIILGFWTGNFISLSLLVNYFSNGVNIATTIIPICLLIAAFVYPLFGKTNHYCLWLCPMGSCQELMGKIIPYKIKMKPQTVQTLTEFREWLWIVIMMVMWLEVGFELLDYELFSAFLFQQASVPLLIVAGLTLVLSGIVQRPYCRFVCPTGSLMKYSQQSK